MFVYIENIKNPTVRFRVLAYDKDSKMGKLAGEYGAEFSRDLSKPALAKFGYRIVKSEEELPLASSALPRKKGKKAAPAEETEEE